MRPFRGLIATVVLAACVVSPEPESGATGNRYHSQQLQTEGLLLLMADRRVYEPLTLGKIASDYPQLKREIAICLGRIRDSRGRERLAELLGDRDARVRRAAAFAMAGLEAPEAGNDLMRAVRDADIDTARWAIEGLSRLEARLAEVVRAAEGRSGQQLWRRFVPVLFRFPSQQSFPLATSTLTLVAGELRAMSAYAVARDPMDEAAPVLRELLHDRDPWVRGWAARGLGKVGSREDLILLEPLLEDVASGPIIQALRAGHQLVSSGRAAPAESWRSHLRSLIDDPRPGVSLTAIETAGAWLLDADLGDRLADFVATARPRWREVALLALASGHDPRAIDLERRLTLSGEPGPRSWAARAAAISDERELVESLFADPEAEVRLRAIEGLLRRDDASSWARRALADAVPEIRATALEWAVGNPVIPVEDLSRAMAGSRRNEVFALRLHGTAALVSRATAEPLERGLIVRNLESLARVGEYPARRAAADGLQELGRPRPAIGAAESLIGTAAYSEILWQSRRRRTASIHTGAGTLKLELDCAVAPMTCLSFIQLVSQGFYDGQRIHRVVPDFVVQAGDPTGLGGGGPGYTIRDELSPTPFERGTLGMASLGPDTAGSQFFITLSRQPHLDGRYTAFGRVIEGDEVLDGIVQGDTIHRIELAP